MKLLEFLRRSRRSRGVDMAGKADRLHGDQSIRDVVARLLAAMESLPAPSIKAKEQPFVVFLFSSLQQGQGTSTIAAAVARALAGCGKRTVLAVVGSPTGESVPLGSIPLGDVVEGARPVAFDDPPLLTLHVPSHYTDLPVAARSPQAWLRGCDVMIIDAHPLTDSLTRYWVPSVHGVVLVLDGEEIAVRAVIQAREDLVALGGNLIGVVLNRYRSRIPRFLERYFTYG